MYRETQVSDRLGMSGVNPLVKPRTPYRASEGKRSQNPAMPYYPTLTSSSVHNTSQQWTAFIA